MPNSKISALPSATTPLAGTETLPIVQGGITEQVSVANLTAARAVTMGSGIITGRLGFGSAAANNTGIYYRTTATAITGATTGYGVLMDTPFASDVTGAAIGVYSRINTAAAAYTVTNTYGFRAANTALGAGSAVTTQAGLYVDDLTSGANNYGVQTAVSSGSNKWNIYASGTANNAFAGNVRIGSTTAPTVALDVTGALAVSGNTTLGDASTDTVTVNGYMGVGGAPNPAYGIRVLSTALTGAQQIGYDARVVGTTSATSSVRGYVAVPGTADAVFTCSETIGFLAASPARGAASTITTSHGVYISDQNQATNNYGVTSLVSSGSNKWNIYASGTANNAFAGNVRFGGVTAPTVAVDVTGAVAATTTITSSGATSGVGYRTGAGGAVTQATSRTTGVTLNNVCGAITLFTAAGSTTATTFTVTNSAVAATDTIIVNQKSGTNLYVTLVTAVAAGSFNITFYTTGGTASDAPVFNFAVIKAVAA